MKILVVEDSVLTRHLVLHSLKELDGVDVMEASDGIDGYMKATAVQYDLVIVDINMPLMNGYELIKKLRALDTYKTVPILVVSVECAPEDQKKALDLGATAYLTKPVKALDISRAIQSMGFTR